MDRKIAKHFKCILLLSFIGFTHGVLGQEFKSTPFPDRIVLTWSDNALNTQTVTWRTDETVQQSMGQIRLEDGSPIMEEKLQEYPGQTEILIGKDGQRDQYHHVTFDKLKPASIYTYRVGDGMNWSEWFQFQTAESEFTPFSFIYLGDGQNDLKSRWSRTIRQAFQRQPDARFIIHAGDLINRANTDSEWGEWHYGAGFIHAMIPAIPTPGNHEYFRDSLEVLTLDPHWKTQYTLPDNGPDGLKESVYYIDYQNIRVVSLNSQMIVLDEGALENQVQWLDSVLSNNPMKWTIITFHHPVYSTSKNRDNILLKDRFKPLFDKYGVDLVLQGHDHTYARGKGPDATLESPVYVVSVAGPKMYESDSERWMEVSLVDIQLYQIIDVSQDKLIFKTYKVSGELFDTFEIVKK